jgi:flagellar biosynthetic protein FliO
MYALHVVVGVFLVSEGTPSCQSAEPRTKSATESVSDATVVSTPASIFPASATGFGFLSDQHANRTFAALQRYYEGETESLEKGAHAETVSKSRSPQSEKSFMQYLGKMLISLALVIFFALALAWLAKRFVVKNRTLGGGYIHVLGSYALSSKAQIHLVRVGEECFLVGEGGASLSLISEVKLPGAVPSVEEAFESAATSDNGRTAPSFGENLSQWQTALEGKTMQKEVQASLLLLGGLAQRLRRKSGETHE